MRIIKQIFLFISFFIITLLAAEIFIRLTYISNVSSTEFYNDIGRGRRKNLKYVYFNEGFGIGCFNKYRYIGENRTYEKEDNEIRIILLGDSYVESFQVFERDYFGNVAEYILNNEKTQYNFQILNFGRSGFDIADMYAYQELFAKRFNPDIIIYMISNGDLYPTYNDPLRPKTIVRNDSLIIDMKFSQKEIDTFNKTKFLTQNSSIMQMSNIARKKINTEPVFSILLEKIYTWISHEDTLKKQNEITYKNIPPITVKIVKSLDPEKTIIINRSHLSLSHDFVELCQNKGLKLLDISKILTNMEISGVDPYKWEVTNKRGHWNNEGHRVIGYELANYIKDYFINKGISF